MNCTVPSPDPLQLLSHQLRSKLHDVTSSLRLQFQLPTQVLLRTSYISRTNDRFLVEITINRFIVLSQQPEQVSGAAMVLRWSAYIHPRLVWGQVCGSCNRHRWGVWRTCQARVFRKKLNSRSKMSDG